MADSEQARQNNQIGIGVKSGQRIEFEEVRGSVAIATKVKAACVAASKCPPDLKHRLFRRLCSMLSHQPE